MGSHDPQRAAPPRHTPAPPATAAPTPATAPQTPAHQSAPDRLIAGLTFLHDTLPPAEFARILRTNDSLYQAELGPYGWHGSWVHDSDYLRDFQRVRDSAADAVSRPLQPQLLKPVPDAQPVPPPAPAAREPAEPAGALRLPPGLAAPADATTDWEQQGFVMTIRQRLSRDGHEAMLVTTADPSPFRIISQRLYRLNGFEERYWTDVSDEAARAGPLNLEWNMPDLRSDRDRIRDMEGPGLLYGFFPSHVAPYMRDQTLGIRSAYLQSQARPGQQTARAATVVTADLIEYAATSVVPEASGAAQALHNGMRAGSKLARPTAGTIARTTATAGRGTARSAARPAASVAETVADSVAEVSRAAAKTTRPSRLLAKAREVVAAAKIGLSNADEVAMRTGSSALQTSSQVERSGARLAARPAAAGAAKPVTKPAVAAAPRPVTKPAIAAAPRPATKPAIAAAPRPVTRPAIAAAPRPVTKPAIAVAPRPVTKPVVQAVSRPAAQATVTGSARPAAGQALVGSSRAQMRRAAERLIMAVSNHPLRFLLNAAGRFHSQAGLTAHDDLADHPELIQMGHIGSDKLGGPERLMLQGAWENQFNNVTIEGPHVGGAVLFQEAISIGGIAVDRRTAQFWEDIGWLAPGTVANSPRIAP